MTKNLSLNKTNYPLTNLLQNLEIDQEYFLNLLFAGDLYAFEEELYQFVMQHIYDQLARIFLQNILSHPLFMAQMAHLASRSRLGKLQKRAFQLQLRSGTYLTLEAPYARVVPPALKGSRYPCLRYWGVIAQASPGYYAQVSKLAVLCGSFEIATTVLQGFQMRVQVERLRNLALAVAKKCLPQRVACMLGPEDNLAGKRVIISMDGGRIRTREYHAEANKAGTRHKFATPWKEPKLFVITVLDAEGKIERREWPVYDATFGEANLFKLLREYLEKLNIKQAAAVQVIADGALWIWHNAKKMLLELGVKEDKIVETLDYYHAVEHLARVTELLPRTKQVVKNKLFKEYKELLWSGQVKELLARVKSRVKEIAKPLKTELGYFEKNQERLNYPQYEADKWLCGSGIIESGVRRMINLRFKAASSFWRQENLDGLIFLRCALLSGRWKFVMQTLTSF
jgi:hypothetical protein